MRYRSLSVACAVVAAASLAGGAGASGRPAQAARTVAFGSSVTLRGVIPGASAGTKVKVVARVCGFSGDVPVGFTTTRAGGTYAYTFQPMLNSTVYPQTDTQTGAATTLRVKPGVQVRRTGAHTFAIDVSAGNGAWFTKPVVLQRLDPRSNRWRKIATAALKANSDPGALTSVSSATIDAAVKKGTQLRALVPQSTVGACYLPAASPTLTA